MNPTTTCRYCGEQIVRTIWADWSAVRAVIGRYVNQCPSSPTAWRDHEPVLT